MKMKNLLPLLPCLMLACGVVSCNDDEPSSRTIVRVEPAEGLTFEAEGGTKLLTIDAQGAAWTVQKSDSWINLMPQQAQNRIEVTVGPWDEVRSRGGEITISGGTEPVVVKVVQKGVKPTLEADPTQLTFSNDGGFESVAVTAPHVEWQVSKPDAEWITAEQKMDGTILVTVTENPDKAIRNGSFRITGEGVEDLIIEVSQQAGVDFRDRPTAYRMGYRGRVKNVSKHIDLVNNLGRVELTDLLFDQRGNLTQFRRDGGAMTVTSSYDAQNRPTAIAAKSAELDFSLLLEYGSHGKFIPVFELFEYDLDVLLPLDFRVWMPFLLKDLAVLKVRDRMIPDNNLDYRFVPGGNVVSVDVYFETGEEFYPAYYTIDFTGDYPGMLNSEGSEYASYEIETASGKIIRQRMYSIYDILLEYSLDRRNTISRACYGRYDMSLTYNDNSDLVLREMAAQTDIRSCSIDYQYDSRFNWSSLSINYPEGPSEQEDRTITYWE